MAFLRSIVVVYASSGSEANYAYYGSNGRNADETSYAYYGSNHRGADESPSFEYYGTCLSSGCGGVASGGVAGDGLPGIELNDAQLAVVGKAASQAADGLLTTIQLLDQHMQENGPIGDLFERIFRADVAQNLADEGLIRDRLQMVLDMMREHMDRVEYVYCPEDTGNPNYDCSCQGGACVVAYVLAGGKLGEDDESPFSVHLGKVWWDAPEEWREECKAGVLIHEFTHHVFHTLDEGYNYEHKHLTDDEKKMNAAAYQNLVVEVMVARQRDEL